MKTLLLIILFLFAGCFGDSQTHSNFHPGLGRAQLVVTNSPVRTFSDIDIGSAHELLLEIKNTGSFPASPLSTSSFFFSSNIQFLGGGYPGTGGNCGSLIPAGETCNMVVVFRPVELGLYSESVSVFYRGYSNGVMRTDSLLSLTATSVLGSPGGLVKMFNTTGILISPFQ